MPHPLRQRCAFAAALGFALPVNCAAPPDSPAYPNKAIRMITGSTGSTADITARFVGQKLGERWGQHVVVN